jgi:hypothetical protein
VGGAERGPERHRHRGEEARGLLNVVRQPSPWSVTAGFAERLVDFLRGLLPGKCAQPLASAEGP